jgi:hypothetical protein
MTECSARQRFIGQQKRVSHSPCFGPQALYDDYWESSSVKPREGFRSEKKR